MQCAERVCLRGLACRKPRRTPEETAWAKCFRDSLDATLDVAGESERVLCRIAELVYFAIEMHYRRVGLAFCADLFVEAETVSRVLGRFVDVLAVCCKLGGEIRDGVDAENGPGAATCNPFSMARALNEAETDLNVILGLSMGADVVFTQLSLAPVTTLFVKDRLLANNPIAAVHSRYVLDRVLSEG